MEKDEKTKKQPNIFQLLWFVYKRYYKDTKFAWQIWTFFFFEVLDNAYPLLFSYMLAKVIDRSMSLISTNGSFEQMIPTIVIFGIMTIVWIGVNSFYQYLDAKIYLWISYLEDRVYLEKYLEIEPQAYEDPEFVNDKSTLAWNSWTIWNSFNQGFQILCIIPVMIVSFLAILKISPLLAGIAIIACLPSAFVTKKFGKKVWNIWSDRGEEKIKYSSYRDSIWTTSFQHYQEIFVFQYGKYLLDKAKELNVKFIKKLDDNNKKRYAWFGGANIIGNVAYLFALGYSIKLVFDGNLTIGMLTFVVSAYDKFNRDIASLFNDFSALVGNRMVLEKFYALQNWKNKIISGDKKIGKANDGMSLEFKNVWFKYPRTDRWILKNLNFKIDVDEDLAVVGKNGAGKTTLIKLLLRIYDPDKGDILINGINIKDLDLDSYYKNIGILSQSFNQLEVTARDNIFIGDVGKSGTQDGLENAAKRADVHDAIVALEKGYETFLSRQVKGGVQLSGGQWQKLAIARAFYRDAKLLILDEPTSAVDALSEEKIFDNIRENAKNKTTLIVSHRFATVRKAKRIIVINNGEIVEDGKHEDLMNQNGLYAKMYRTQVEKI